MTHLAYSTTGIPIRLTDERWNHIVENHDDLAGYYFEVLEAVEKPTWVFAGDEDELWAVKRITGEKALLVMYRESQETQDGFIITAFFTTKMHKLRRRRKIWPQP